MMLIVSSDSEFPGYICSRILILQVPYLRHTMFVSTYLARVDAGCYTLWEFLQNETLLKHVVYRYLDRVLERIQINVDIP